MNGIRVSNIPIQLSERLLRKYFTDASHGGGEIKSIYYPLINNDAVIIFQQEITAVTAVVKKSEENSGSFRIAPLPHQVFSSVDVHLDPGLSTFVLATDEYIKTLREWGLGVSTGIKGHETCTLSGSWYKVEWAWNYLSQIMEKQHAIHHRLQTQISQDDSDLSSEFSDRDISPLSDRLTNGTVRSVDNKSSVSSSHSRRNEGITNSGERNGRTTRHLVGSQPESLLNDRSTNENRGAHGRKSNQRISSATAQIYGSRFEDENVDYHQQIGLSLTSSLGESLDQDTSSRNTRARDADSTFNHFTSIQAGGDSPRHQSRVIGQHKDGAASTSSILDHNQDTYRVNTPDSESPERLEVPYIDDIRQQEEADDADESDSGTIHDRHSIASGHSDTSQNSLRESRHEQIAISASIGQYPSTSSGRFEQYSSINSSGSHYGASASLQADEEVPDGYKSHALKIDNLRIKIYLADITKSTAEAIVNAANSELKNFSGVARSISKAAGEFMETECENYIAKYGRLDTTHVMHTSSSGQLKQFKYILHTVGPIYIGEKYKEDCSFQLIQTFVNCLIYAEEKLYLKSLALPFISTGVYAAPLEDCVAAFIDAVLIFIHKYKRSCTLAEIHLVNNDINVVSMASTLLQSILDGADIEQMAEDAVRNFEMKISTSDDLFTRSFTATGASGGRPKDSGLRRCSSMDYLNKDSYFTSSVARSYDTSERKDIIGAAGTPSSNCYRSGSFTNNRKSPDKKFSQSESPKLSNSQDLTTHSATRNGDYRTSQKNSSAATASKISHSLKKNLSQSNTKSPRSSISPMKAFPQDLSSETRKYKAGGGTSKSVAGRLAQSNRSTTESFTSLPADLNRSRASCEPSIDPCGICLEEMINPKTLEKCGHTFCQDCLKHAFVSKPVCPECGMIYGVIIGDQPRGGKMIHKIDRVHKLEGFPDAEGVLEITYSFSDGIQGENHPNPRQPFHGIKRKAFLPNNKEGQEILQMLYKAFDARLVFTIGESCTTGQTGVLTWNDIHHKTSMTGGPTHHGYPDSTYLKRVREELAMKGIHK